MAQNPFILPIDTSNKTSTPASILDVTPTAKSMEFPLLPGVSIQDGKPVTVQPSPAGPSSLQSTLPPTTPPTAPTPTASQEPLQQVKSSTATAAPKPEVSPFQLSQYLDIMKDKIRGKNELADMRAMLITGLYDRPLSPEELAKLPENVRKSVEGGNKRDIEFQLRLLNDQIKGRTNTLDQSVKYLVDEYKDSINRIDNQRQQSIQNVLQFSQQYGSQAKEAMRALYGDDYVESLKQYGIDIDNLAQLPYTSAEREKFGGTSNFGTPIGTLHDLPAYDTALANPGVNRPNRNNNPGNIKVSAWSKSLPGVIGVESRPSTDGGNFLIFDSPQSGINAISELLKVGKSYQGVNADTAMKRYSGGGYGAAAVGLDPTQDFQSQIADPAKLKTVIDALTKREGFTGVGGGGTLQPFFGLPKDVYNAGASIANNFRQEQVVKDFNVIQNKQQAVDRIIDQGVGGPGDLALVFEFMKALDPNSVVRETEYETAAKSGNIFKGAMAKFNGYLKEEGGFLPENVKQAFRDITQTKFEVAKSQYDNTFSEYSRKIDSAIGKQDMGQQFLIDYSKAFPSESGGNMYTQSLDEIFNSMNKQ